MKIIHTLHFTVCHAFHFMQHLCYKPPSMVYRALHFIHHIIYVQWISLYSDPLFIQTTSG